jgi:hypothetical protein
MLSAGKKLMGRRHMVNDFLDVFQKENGLITREEIYYFF